MAKIVRRLSSRIDSAGECQILLRLTVSSTKQVRIKSGLHIAPKYLNDGRFVYPRKNPAESARVREIENKLISLERHLINIVAETHVSKIDSELMNHEACRHLYPEKARHAEYAFRIKMLGIDAPGSFYGLFENYLQKPISEVRKRNLRSLARSIRRFELYKQYSSDPAFSMDVSSITRKTIDEIIEFWKNEHKIYDECPKIFMDSPILPNNIRCNRKPQPKGNNAITDLFKRLRAFFNWAVSEGYIAKSPFQGYKNAPKEKYGIPWYMTKAELDKVADFDLTACPALSVQRDIFVFQSLVGCRIGDLRQLGPANIIGDTIQYIPHKTKGERPEVVTVPLTRRAKEILNRYEEQRNQTRRILPFISEQRYNDNIKIILKRCGINRIVTIVNPTTGNEEQHPICDIASSHMARRNFSGIQFKAGVPVDIICSMTGHAPGSKAFARYREIDTDIKRTALSALE